MKKLLALLTIALLAFTLSACGSEEPEDVVKAYLDHLQAFELEKASALMNTEEDYFPVDSNDEEVILSTILGLMEYEVLSSSSNGDKATVEVTVSNIHMTQVMSRATQAILTQLLDDADNEVARTEEEQRVLINNLFLDHINDPDNERLEGDFTVELTKVDGKYLIEPNDNMVYTVMGQELD